MGSVSLVACARTLVEAAQSHMLTEFGGMLASSELTLPLHLATKMGPSVGSIIGDASSVSVVDRPHGRIWLDGSWVPSSDTSVKRFAHSLH